MEKIFIHLYIMYNYIFWRQKKNIKMFKHKYFPKYNQQVYAVNEIFQRSRCVFERGFFPLLIVLWCLMVLSKIWSVLNQKLNFTRTVTVYCHLDALIRNTPYSGTMTFLVTWNEFEWITYPTRMYCGSFFFW